MSRFENYINRKRREFGERFDPSDLAPQFIPYYESGQRIVVQTPLGEERGYVGVTTGWRPRFLLLHSRRSTGSSILLGPGCEVKKTLNKFLF